MEKNNTMPCNANDGFKSGKTGGGGRFHISRAWAKANFHYPDLNYGNHKYINARFDTNSNELHVGLSAFNNSKKVQLIGATDANSAHYYFEPYNITNIDNPKCFPYKLILH